MNNRPAKTLNIHIGLHKSGSTFLQKSVFPLMFPDSPVHNDINTLKEIYRKFRECKVDDNISLLSNEGLSGLIKPSYKGNSYDEFLKTIENLKSIDRETQILFIVRSHKEYLRSAYLHKVKKGYSASFENFINSHSEKDLSWSARIRELEKNGFPFLVLDFHDLKNNPLDTLGLVADFWKCDLPREKIKDKLNSKKHKNTSPKNYKAITLLRTETKIRRRILSFLNLYLFRNRIKIYWRNRRFRQWVVSIFNSIFNNNLKNYKPPAGWGKKLQNDWEITLKYITRP